MGEGICCQVKGLFAGISFARGQQFSRDGETEGARKQPGTTMEEEGKSWGEGSLIVKEAFLWTPARRSLTIKKSAKTTATRAEERSLYVG